MNRPTHSLLLLTTGLTMLTLASCSNKPKETPTLGPADSGTKVVDSGDNGTRTVYVEPGVAGGIVEDTVVINAKVTAIDHATRRVTLTGAENDTATFTASPDIRNLDQVKVGDTLTATLNQKLVIYVRSGREQESVTYDAALGRAPKGAKPGMLAGQAYEVVASVAAIDTDTRTATLKFVDNSTKKVKVRPDVDLARYKVGDTVVIRITSSLALLVAAK